jgi:hypothetical protein
MFFTFFKWVVFSMDLWQATYQPLRFRQLCCCMIADCMIETSDQCSCHDCHVTQAAVVIIVYAGQCIWLWLLKQQGIFVPVVMCTFSTMWHALSIIEARGRPCAIRAPGTMHTPVAAAKGFAEQHEEAIVRQQMGILRTAPVHLTLMHTTCLIVRLLHMGCHILGANRVFHCIHGNVTISW